MNPCLFCDVATGKLPTFKVYEDDDVLVFLDKRPLFLGHCLLIPKPHYETISDLPEKFIGPFFTTLQRLANVVQKGMRSEGTFVAMNNVVNQSVPHLHVHVVPRNKGDGLKGFFWPRRKQSEAEFIIVQQKLIDTWHTLYKLKQ